jgi:hypothetical protein
MSENPAFKCVPHSTIKQISIHNMSNPSIEFAAKRRVETKGKHASSTENRRLVWEKIVWPLILDVNRSYFNLREYHAKRDQFCNTFNIRSSKVAGGLVSLLVKGILVKQRNIYSIHYRLIPYMRKRVTLDYGLVLREINAKR